MSEQLEQPLTVEEVSDGVTYRDPNEYDKKEGRYTDPDAARLIHEQTGDDVNEIVIDGRTLDFYRFHHEKHEIDHAKRTYGGIQKERVSELNKNVRRAYLETVANKEISNRLKERLGEIAAIRAVATANKKRFRSPKYDRSIDYEEFLLEMKQDSITRRNVALGGELPLGYAKKFADRYAEELYLDALETAQSEGVKISTSDQE